LHCRPAHRLVVQRLLLLGHEVSADLGDSCHDVVELELLLLGVLENCGLNRVLDLELPRQLFLRIFPDDQKSPFSEDSFFTEPVILKSKAL
jgi:hypothetical protein